MSDQAGGQALANCVIAGGDADAVVVLVAVASPAAGETWLRVHTITPEMTDYRCMLLLREAVWAVQAAVDKTDAA